MIGVQLLLELSPGHWQHLVDHPIARQEGTLSQAYFCGRYVDVYGFATEHKMCNFGVWDPSTPGLPR